MHPSLELSEAALGGVRVLVVEDEFLIAMELVALLEEAGAEIVGPCANVREALSAAGGEQFSVAILDLRLGGELASPVARELSRRGVPFIFYTGQAHSDPILAEWPHVKVMAKPASPKQIVDAIARLLH
jgi:DNA-binding response OmpR family regulator